MNTVDSTNSTGFTEVPYYYKDASGWSRTREVYLDGKLSSEDISAIESKLNDGECFIPFDLPGLNLDELQSELKSFPSEDDHVWHTLSIGEIRTLPSVPEGTSLIDVADFIAAFAAIRDANSWDVVSAAARLEL